MCLTQLWYYCTKDVSKQGNYIATKSSLISDSTAINSIIKRTKNASLPGIPALRCAYKTKELVMKCAKIASLTGISALQLQNQRVGELNYETSQC